jgi:phosphoesterase RecJ-like protein
LSSKIKVTPLLKSKEFRKFKTQLSLAKRVLISTHKLPDGDGLGAEVALFHYLKRAKKACRVLNPDPLPKRYRFLDPENLFLHGPGEGEIWNQWDLWVIVDTNDPRRLGKLWEEFSVRSKQITFLDHHPDMLGVPEVKYPPHASLVSDPYSSSIGELLYRLFDELNLTQINSKVALGLYVSVMTDTNSFRYARTTPLAHRIAAHMIELKVNPEEVYQAIYSSKEISHIQLLGKMLQNVQVSADRKVAWFQMTRQLRHQHQASADDTQSFLNLLLLIKDAEVVCFFREEDNGQIRASLKSKGQFVINQIAMELGGGGHEYAAGLALSAPLDKTVDMVISRIEKLIQSQEKQKQ